MWATKLFVLAVLVIVGEAGPDGLRGTGGEKAVVEADTQHDDVVRATQVKTPQPSFDKRELVAGVGLEALRASFETGQDPWRSAGEALNTIGPLVAVAVPGPPGLVVGGLMILSGSLMSFFAEPKASEPSVNEIMDSFNQAFAKLDLKIADLAKDVQKVQSDLNNIAVVVNKVYRSTVLEGARIKGFTQRMAELSRRLFYAMEADANQSVLWDEYTVYQHDIVEEYAHMQGGIGALGSPNLDQMLLLLEKADPSKDLSQDYALVTDKVTLYKWFYQARASLYNVLNMAATMKRSSNEYSDKIMMIKMTGHTKMFAEDVQGFDEVLKKHHLGNATKFQNSHARNCSKVANSVMQTQGLTLRDFMNPYIYLTHGDCSHPAGDDASLNVLIDVDSQECDASKFWNGRSETDENTKDHQVYNNSNLQPQWLKSCPADVVPIVKRDDLQQASHCGCELSGSGIQPVVGAELKNPRQTDSKHTFRIIKNSHGICLDAHERDVNGKVHMWPCEGNHDSGKWHYDSETGQIKSKISREICSVDDCGGWPDEHCEYEWYCETTYYCLHASERNVDGGKVVMWPCNTRRVEQQWIVQANGQIKNKDGLCLDAANERSTEGGKVHMWTCDESNRNQQWSHLSRYYQIQPSFVMCRNTCFA
jgi:hypothetical protein